MKHCTEPGLVYSQCKFGKRWREVTETGAPQFGMKRTSYSLELGTFGNLRRVILLCRAKSQSKVGVAWFGLGRSRIGKELEAGFGFFAWNSKLHGKKQDNLWNTTEATDLFHFNILTDVSQYGCLKVPWIEYCTGMVGLESYCSTHSATGLKQCNAKNERIKQTDLRNWRFDIG